VGIKLNLGASPIWSKDGWHTLDHKLLESTATAIAGDATNIRLPDGSCDIVFCSHVFEHIPHTRLPIVLSEINRVLRPGGVLRLLTPDLEIIAKAYVEKNDEFFRLAKEEDESMRTDLGYGGTLMNFIVSPGQDTVLLNRDMSEFIAGYAHLYSYDYAMLNIMMTRLGYSTRKAIFNDSEVPEMQTPLHVLGLNPEWQNFNQEFYKKNNLVHRLVDGKYEINFKVTGFDRDPLTSLIIEAKKQSYVDRNEADAIYNKTLENYNRYSWSLLRSPDFVSKLDELEISYPADK
jgi:predicted SAM-dependent methyltransferase